MSSFETNDQKINYQVCRICVHEKDDLKSIFNPLELEDIQEEGVTTLADVLSTITLEPVSVEDNLPHLICMNCAELLFSAYLFKLKYEKSSTLFEDYLRKLSEPKDVEEADDQNDILIKIDYDDVEYSDVKEEILIISQKEDAEEKDVKPVRKVKKKKRVRNNEEPTEKIMHSCPICTEEFTADDLREHARTHTALKKYLSISDEFKVGRSMKFYYKHNPNEERTTIHSRPVKIHKCPACNVELPVLELRAHLKKHQFSNNYKCDQCDRIFRKINHLNTHKVKHLKECPFKCEQCGKGFVIQKNYECHMLTHTNAEELPHQCPHCYKRFSNPEHLNRHVIIHTEKVSYAVKYKVCKCNSCLRAFKDMNELKEHKCVPLKNTSTQVFRCKLCDKVFKNSNVLYSHKRAVHYLSGVKALCSVCGHYSSNIYNHMKMHSDVKPFECDQCDKRFGTNRQLQQHLLVHSGLKPFICSVCGKAFNNIYNLQVHERIHKGDRCHVCHVCGKGFLEKSYLKKHLNIHLKVE